MNDLSHSEIAQGESSDNGDPLSARLRRIRPHHIHLRLQSPEFNPEMFYFSVRLSGQEVL